MKLSLAQCALYKLNISEIVQLAQA